MIQFDKLIAIKSILEFNKNYNLIEVLLDQLVDKKFSNELKKEIIFKNYGNSIKIIEDYMFENIENIYYYNKEDIKIFDFNSLENISVNEFKKKVGIQKIGFNPTNNSNGIKTENYMYWNNEDRYAIFCNKTLLNLLKSNKDLKINVRKEIKLAKLGFYTKFTFLNSKDLLKNNCQDSFKNIETYEDYNGTYAQEHYGYSDQFIDDVFDGDPDNIWNLD